MASQLLGDLRPTAVSRKRPAPPAPGNAAFVGPRLQRRKRDKKFKTAAEYDLPFRTDAFAPESRLYTALRAMEQRIDACITRRHIELHDAQQAAPHPHNRPPNHHVLRIQIYNEYHNQQQPGTAPAAAGAAGGAGVGAERMPLPGTNADERTVLDAKGGVEDEPAAWTLKITGHIIDPTTGNPLPRNTPYVFSNFLQKMTVELDPKVYTDANAVIEWTKGTAPAAVDGFEVKRRGTRDVYAKITLALDYSPPRYTLSLAMQQLLGVDVPETKPRLLAALWQYIKHHRLQDAADPSVIVPNAQLQHALGTDARFPMHTLTQRLRAHLSAPEIVLRYPIRVSGDPTANSVTYDVSVDAPSDPYPALPSATSSAAAAAAAAAAAGSGAGRRPVLSAEAVDKATAEVAGLIGRIEQHRRRRELLMGFADAPVDALRALIAQHAKRQPVTGADGRDREAERHSAHYADANWLPDAVDRYLSALKAPTLSRPPPPLPRDRQSAPVGAARAAAAALAEAQAQALATANAPAVAPASASAAAAGAGAGAPPLSLQPTMALPYAGAPAAGASSAVAAAAAAAYGSMDGTATFAAYNSLPLAAPPPAPAPTAAASGYPQMTAAMPLLQSTGF